MTQKLVKWEKKRTDHNHDKYMSTPEFNKLSPEIFAAILKQANLVTKQILMIPIKQSTC